VTTAALDSVTIGDALARHYADHRLPADGGENASWFRVHVGPLSIPLPNPPARRRAVFLHDVNHILTGYDTTFSSGEMIIAGFEVGAGCGPFWIAWVINLGMFAFGLVVTPGAMFRAFVRGRRSSSIYRHRGDRRTLSGQTVGTVRRMLRIDAGPPRATLGDRLAFFGWSLIAVVVTIAPPAIVAAAMWRIIRGVGT
jgi:hypothetical protein